MRDRLRGFTFEQIVFWAFVAGLAWAPLLYGGNLLLNWGVNGVIFPGLVAVYEISLLLRKARHPVGINRVALPAALFAAACLWTVFQMQTGDWVPFVHPIWAMASQALGKPLPASISVNRGLTEMGLLRLVTAASVFWLALQLLRNGERAGLFMTAIVVIATAYAIYGLAALAFGPFAFLQIPIREGRVSSTFVGYNSYATYAGMGLIVAVGLIADRFATVIRDSAGSWRHQLAGLIDFAGYRALWLTAAAFLIAVAFILTGSRGGTLATAMGFFCFGVLRPSGSKGGLRVRLVMALTGLAAITAIVAVFGGVLASRFEVSGLSDANRLAVYRLTIHSILDAPWQGFGYGTFIDVFPMYRDASVSLNGMWSQAHSTYLEVFQGLGLIFGSMLIACVGLLGLRCAMAVAKRQKNVIIPRIAAAATVLVGCHALVDFGLQIQAVALTFVAILGAGVAQSMSSRSGVAD